MIQMNARRLAAATAAGLAAAGLLWPATNSQAQLQVAPNFAPMGVASNGNSSTAWFHEPTSGRAMACQTAPAAGGLTPIQCVTVKLPRVEP